MATAFPVSKPLLRLRLCATAAMALACLLGSGASQADEAPYEFFKATHLLGVSQGSSLSDLARGLGAGGFETSGGNKVAFTRWYAPEWVDTRVDFMTQVTPHLGVLWGVSTGERGEKYSIEPSFKFGFLAVYPVSKSARLSFSASAILGGRMQESACTADYGDIGGVQQVNCRMAASELAPAQTLAYLVNKDPANKSYVSLQYTLSF